MYKDCTACSASFEITDEDLAFYERVSPVFNDEKEQIPPPTLCPDCRQQRRLAACNEMNMYPGTCNKCDKKFVTQFASNHTGPVWCRECWLKDDWDPRDFGQEYDESRPFLEQFQELRMRVPEEHLAIDGDTVNCDYMHYAGWSKNSYLIMHADFCEDCMYGYGFKKNTSCVDGFYNLHCELCYDCIDVHKCYGLKGCQECNNCSHSAFLRDCVGCQHCFLCTGLREKKYCYQNEQLSKEDYEQKMSEIDLGSHKTYQECHAKLAELSKNHVFKEYCGHNLERCSGDHLTNCKECTWCYDCEDGESLKHCYQLVLGAKNTQDCYQYGTNLQESYDCAIVGDHSYHALFSLQIFNSCSDVYYCYFLGSCKYMFGCTQMRGQRYCILNKQYSEEDWNALVPKIIQKMRRDGEWGSFFPSTISQFGYNQTTAQMYYPLTKEEAVAKGFLWSDYVQPDPESEKVIDAAQLPDSINDIPDDVLNWAIRCEKTGVLFKLTAKEFAFYKDQHLPVPRRSWQQRHLDRFAKRNPRKLWNRNCRKCSNEIKTSFDPERPETVYCETCYLDEVY